MRENFNVHMHSHRYLYSHRDIYHIAFGYVLSYTCLYCFKFHICYGYISYAFYPDVVFNASIITLTDNKIFEGKTMFSIHLRYIYVYIYVYVSETAEIFKEKERTMKRFSKYLMEPYCDRYIVSHEVNIKMFYKIVKKFSNILSSLAQTS